MIRSCLFLIGALLTATALFAGGVKVTALSTDLSSGKKDQSRTVTYLTKDKMRMDLGGEAQSFIYNKNEETFWVLDHTKDECTVMKKSELKALRKQMKRAMERIEALPEDKRKRMKAQMEKTLGDFSQEARVTYENTEETEKKGEWTCTKYRGESSDELRSKVWTTPYSKVQVDAEDFQVMNELRDFMSVLSDDLGKLTPFPTTASESNEKDEGNALAGLPILRTTYQDGEKAYRSQVISIEEQDIRNDRFTIPSDYEKKKMMQGGSGGMGQN